MKSGGEITAGAIMRAMKEAEVTTDAFWIWYGKSPWNAFNSIPNAKYLISKVPSTWNNNYFEEVKAFTGKIVDTTTLVVLDTCEVLTGWTASTDADEAVPGRSCSG